MRRFLGLISRKWWLCIHGCVVRSFLFYLSTSATAPLAQKKEVLFFFLATLSLSLIGTAYATTRGMSFSHEAEREAVQLNVVFLPPFFAVLTMPFFFFRLLYSMTLCFFFFYCSICFVLLYKREEKKKAHNYSILGIPYIMTGLFDGPASAPLFFFSLLAVTPLVSFPSFFFFFSVSFTWTRQFKCSALKPKHSLLLLLLSYIHTHTTLVTDMIVIIVFLVYDSKLGGGVSSPALGIHDDNNSKEIKEREKKTRTEERIKRALTLMQTL